MQSQSTLSLEAVVAAFDAHEWVFAKTMAWVPHYYVTRDKWAHDIPFDDIVRFIYATGVPMRWGRKPPKPYLDVGEWRYFCMGNPVHETTIINRELIAGSKAVPA